jgi:hypothetical protein
MLFWLFELLSRCLLDSASESLRMIRSKTLPEALNSLGSTSSPRTLCDLNLDFQTANKVDQQQPIIVLVLTCDVN